MNIHKHERTTVINKNIVENDTCNRMPIESKMRKNNNHNIESNISNSNQNIISNIGKKKKRMFWSSELYCHSVPQIIKLPQDFCHKNLN
jgi:hypothetical protein